MLSCLLEAGASFPRNGQVPAKTAGLIAKAATETGYVWGCCCRYRSLGYPLRERWEKAALRGKGESKWFGTPARSPKCLGALKGSLQTPPLMQLHVQLCTDNTQNKGLIQEVLGFFKLFSPTLNSPLMLPWQQMQREIASLQNALSQQHRKSKENEAGERGGETGREGARLTQLPAERRGPGTLCCGGARSAGAGGHQ